MAQIWGQIADQEGCLGTCKGARAIITFANVQEMLPIALLEDKGGEVGGESSA